MNPTLTREGLRPRARRLLSRLAAVLVVGTLLASGAPAAIADDGTPAPDPEPVVELALSVGGGAEVEPGEPVVSTITIANRTDSALSAGTAVIELNRTPLAGSTALDAWLGAGAATGSFQSVATEPTPLIDGGAAHSMSLVADAEMIDDLQPGVYPITAHLSGATTDDGQAWNLTSSSVLVVSSEERSTAVLVPITATPASGALLTAAELTDLTAPDGALSGQLEAVTDTTAILAIDPAIPAAIRMLGSAAPATATDWLQRLQVLPNDRFLLQFGDADATVQAHAKLPALLGTPDLTPLIQAGDFPTPSPSPTATSDPGESPELPENPALTALAGAQPGILWPRPNVDVADLATFADYLDGSATTILPASALHGTAAAHSTAEGNDLLVADDAASARLSAAVELEDRTDIDAALAATAGHLFFAAQRSPTVILALDRSETRSPAALRDALTTFASPKMTLAQLRSTPATATSIEGAADENRVPALQNLLAGEKQLTAFATILDEPALLLTPDRIRLLRAIGVGVSDDDYLARTTEYSERVRTTLDSVGIQRPKPVQLFTSAAPLPVWIRNDLPWEINVSLIGSPSNPRLDMQSVTAVKALASGVQRVDVPLEALVASGEVDVTFTLRSAADVQIGSAEVANVTLRADWERIGLGILAALIGLLFIFGVVRTVRRRKKEADAVSDAVAAASDSKEHDE